jgi:hypothetical protein
MSNQIGGEKMRDLATQIQNQVPGLGFALFVFELGKPGIANYISNAHRDDMIIALEEKIKILKHKRDFPTPNSN